MELPEIEEVEIQYLDQWFANLVDTVNYDLLKIEGAVIALEKILVNLDTAPIQYLKDSLNEMVKKINTGFDQISEQMNALDSRLKALGG